MEGISQFTPQRVVVVDKSKKPNPWMQMLPQLTSEIVSGFVKSKLQGSLQQDMQKQKLQDEMIANGYTWDDAAKTWVPPAVKATPIEGTDQSAVTIGGRPIGLTPAPKKVYPARFAPEMNVKGHVAWYDSDGKLNYQKEEETSDLQFPGDEQGNRGPVVRNVPPSTVAQIIAERLKESGKKDPEDDVTASKLYDDTHRHYKSILENEQKKVGMNSPMWNPNSAEAAAYQQTESEIMQSMLNDFQLINTGKKPMWLQQGVNPKRVEFEEKANEFIRSILK